MSEDLISRSALLKELVFDYAYAAADIVKAAPAVDAVPVVRCKDCRKWHDPYECPMFALEAGDYTTADGRGFCDHGEREYNG